MAEADCVIWDANGNVVMDATTRIGRILGIGNTGGADGSITPAGSDTGALWVLPLVGLQAYTVTGLSLAYMTFTVTSTTISWSYGTSVKPALDFLYGVR
jgi:hypothetical protein